MFFRKKDKIVEHLLPQNPNRTYWQEVAYRFRKNRMAVWALRCLYVLIFVALFADFLANEKPIVCQLNQKVYFPIAKSYFVDLGLAKWDATLLNVDWQNLNYDWKILPPIAYSDNTMDKLNMNYVSPLGRQTGIRSWHYKHWLGTDELGHDVLAGMIHGTRIAVSVGIVAMSIAALIGIFLGTLAGFWGDHQLRISRSQIIFSLLGLVIGFFYSFIAGTSSGETAMSSLLFMLFKTAGMLLLGVLLGNVVGLLFNKLPWLGKKIAIPADLLVMRLIEIINSIPPLLLILCIVAVTRPSVVNVMVIIGLISWTSIARFVRAELLKVRNLEYIEAAQAMGFSDLRIVLRHALPNALTPVLIAIAFGVASAILTESFLSFLSVGVAADTVTWGSLLNMARSNFGAWWLALFPGLAIFLTVTIFNLIGEGLTDALDPRLKL
ncbi:MAG: ABC transporter permease [Chitinophagales bacterium]|nr:ABC transporter permease [Chitinophagales bacterium]